MTDLCLADRFRELPKAKRDRILEALEADGLPLSDLHYDWDGFWARPDQIVSPEDLERNSLIVFTGIRGTGKTAAAVHLWCREVLAGRARYPRIFAASEGDVEKVVVEGGSGIMSSLPKEDRPVWVKSDGMAGALKFKNGVTALGFSAASAESSVGHQGDLDLYDDVAKWSKHVSATAWAHARMSCRIGYGVGIVATTRRGTTLLRKLLKGNLDGVLIRRPENHKANKFNLTARYFRQMEKELGDSELYLQELEDQDIGNQSPFDGFDLSTMRVDGLPPSLVAIAVWVDPATSSGSQSCEIGIVVVGLDSRGVVYAIEDLSARMNSAEWPRVAMDAFERWQSRCANIHIGVETNKGGNMVAQLLRNEERIRHLQRNQAAVDTIRILEINAKQSKCERAAPCASLLKANRIKFLPKLRTLESQLAELSDDEGAHTDRADAFVHAVRDLALGAYPVSGAPADAYRFTGGVAPMGSIAVGGVSRSPVANDGASGFRFGLPSR